MLIKITKKHIRVSILLFTCLNISFLFADEGIWIPLLLSKYNEADMQQKGLRITADDIYSINHSSLKDAVLLFGRGCTGEVVSGQGLLFTNHHCGKSMIQSHSTIEHNYLKDGFWAKSKEDELPCPGLTVSFLVRMEDVSEQVLKNISPAMNESERYELIEAEIKKIIDNETKGTYFNATVEPVFSGNQYFLYVMETFSDIRLVGAPPISIGDFGSETDNWMWPRHSADFALFRIYADSNNQPAKYSRTNIPYKPKQFLEISLKGIQENDFTMVYGFPAHTQEYLPSYAVEMLTQIENPVSIKINRKKLDIMNEFMNQSEQVKIQYTSRYFTISNFWKKSIGQNNGLLKYNAIDKKKALENEFNLKLNSDSVKKNEYIHLMHEYEKTIRHYSIAKYWTDFYYDAFATDDLFKFIKSFRSLASIPDDSSRLIKIEFEKLKKISSSFFTNSNLSIVEKTYSAMLDMFCRDVDSNLHPAVFSQIQTKFKNNTNDFSSYLFKKSIFVSSDKIQRSLTHFNKTKLLNDPLFKLTDELINYYYLNFQPALIYYENKLDSMNRIFMATQLNIQKNKLFYSDANSSLRLTYGKISGYQSTDGISYHYNTNLNGLIEKNKTNKEEYNIPNRLKELFNSKEYGCYAVKDTLPLCFIATNHTSGGNSGSPVLNGNGQLIGINFDRNWEGTMSDIMYNPETCRNISVDIRYVLFIIDKYAGMKQLVDEMKISKN